MLSRVADSLYWMSRYSSAPCTPRASLTLISNSASISS